MRWLLLKDVQILKRSPLLVSLLVIYPIAIALLIGFALSRGPEKPRVAFANLVPASQSTIELGGRKVDTTRYIAELFKSVRPIEVSSRKAALAKVRSGEARAALVIPGDVTDRLASGLRSAEVEVIYNNQDPVKGRFVDQTISARLAEANSALAQRFKEIAIEDIRLLEEGGSFKVLGRRLEILGLRETKALLDRTLRQLPPGSSNRAALRRVSEFAGLALDNLTLSNQVLGTVSQPVVVKRTTLSGKRTPLDAFGVAVSVAVSLMFVTILLAAGMLALEREENTFLRLVRGLVSRVGLLVEKIGLAAACAFATSLAMLAGIGLFVSLDWSRIGFWLVALAAGALAFGALGAAIGGLAREVRAASLLSFLLSLPIAFVALVPSGSVSTGVYEVVRVVSALFPFKPALQAVDRALNGGESLVLPLVHLGALAVAFAALARLALRRFA